MLLCKGDGLDYLFCAGTRKGEIDEIGRFELQVVAARRGSIHPWVGCMQRFSATCIYTNAGYGRSIHAAKVTRVAYAPTYAGYGIQSSCGGDKATAWASSAAQALNCNKQG